MNSEIISVFDRFAEQYAEFTFSNILQYELNRFISLLPEKAEILDLACGSGRDVQYFLDYGLQPIGIDASENMINEAKKRVPGGSFKVMCFESLNFKNESFGGVWALDALSYAEKKDMPKILESINKVLKKEGVVFSSVRQGDGEQIIKHEKLGKSEIKISFFQQQELENLFTEAGFEILNSFTQDGEDFTWINIYAKKK